MTTANRDGVRTSGSSQSYWIESVSQKTYPTLDADISTDVVVIGAGISGITTGYCLAKKGKRVVVVDDGHIGSGETGRTTAHVVNALDDRYSSIESLFGEEKSRLAAESHTAAINFIERTSAEENIDCDFMRLSGYLFLHTSDKPKTIEEEYEATHRAGINTALVNSMPGIKNVEGPVLEFPEQAQFHPMKYITGLAEAITSMGGSIYTLTRVSEVKKDHVVANGHRISANHIVVATNSPINDLVTMHTKQYPYRTYVVAMAVEKNQIEPALWWDTGDQDSKWISMPYHYVRIQPFSDSHYLLISGGEDHKTGQADAEDKPEEERYKVLEEWTRHHFPQAGELVYRWSGQVLEPLDHVAFIGKNPGDDNIYIVTGDSGNGMTHGTIAGMLITDLITGVENPWADLYDPSRISLKVTDDYIKEAANMAGQYFDYLSAGDIKSAEDLHPGYGGILSKGLKKYAIYKDMEGNVHAYTAICPHLGCVLEWNGEEKSFDCPCHGSRFTCEGKLLNGPASTDLAPVKIGEKAGETSR
jgi:glycine/D-amino acid oxidase-like deaminating enzyme/nitrite reductase/ring-hydroxylating ferredoxin subunit